MKFEKILNQVQNKIFVPIYFLHGEEPYFIDVISNTIQKLALSDEERGFNETIYYGRDTNVIDLIHAARRFPMGASRQLIIVREAQLLDGIDMLESYVKAALKSTILVINYKHKTLDGRTKLASALKKSNDAILFESKKLRDYQLEKWIVSYAKQRKLTIEPSGIIMLIEFLGTEMDKIIQAIDKLTVTLGPSVNHITVDHISKNIGISKEYNVFELQKALIKKDVLKANQIIKAFASNPRLYPVPAITAILFNYFQKLLAYYYLKDKSKSSVASELKINPYFVSDYQEGAKNYSGIKVANIISILREYDMKSKGYNNVNTDGGELLKEMIFKILH